MHIYELLRTVSDGKYADASRLHPDTLILLLVWCCGSQTCVRCWRWWRREAWTSWERTQHRPWDSCSHRYSTQHTDWNTYSSRVKRKQRAHRQSSERLCWMSLRHTLLIVPCPSSPLSPPLRHCVTHDSGRTPPLIGFFWLSSGMSLHWKVITVPICHVIQHHAGPAASLSDRALTSVCVWSVTYSGVNRAECTPAVCASVACQIRAGLMGDCPVTISAACCLL